MAEQGNGSKTEEQINEAGAAEDAKPNGVVTVADEPTTDASEADGGKPHEEQTPDQGEAETTISEPGADADSTAGTPEADTGVVPIVETPAEPSPQRAPKKAAAKKKVAKKPAAKKAATPPLSSSRRFRRHRRTAPVPTARSRRRWCI